MSSTENRRHGEDDKSKETDKLQEASNNKHRKFKKDNTGEKNKHSGAVLGEINDDPDNKK